MKLKINNICSLIYFLKIFNRKITQTPNIPKNNNILDTSSTISSKITFQKRKNIIKKTRCIYFIRFPNTHKNW